MCGKPNTVERRGNTIRVHPYWKPAASAIATVVLFLAIMWLYCL